MVKRSLTERAALTDWSQNMSLDLLSADEVAKELKISRRTLLRMHQSGGGPIALRIGGRLKYPSEDFRNYLVERYREAMEAQAGKVSS